MAETQGFKARVEYEVTDGTQLLYTFPFSYLRKKFIKVDVLHADNSITSLTYGVDYVVNDLALTLTNPVKVGEHLIIYRQTTTDKIITWNDGSILLASDMNTEDVQMLHLQEEQQDYIQAHSINTKTDSATKEVLWDALNHRVVNVNDPIDTQDVVTKHYMENVQGGFVVANTKILNDAKDTLSATQQAQSKAQANEELSKAWATSTESPDNEEDTQSSTGETQSSRSWALYSKSKAQESAMSEAHAKTSETNAKDSETKARLSEQNAKSSETNAKTSETKAATSEANAKTSETNAKTSETKSKDSENAARISEQNAAESAKIATEYGRDFNMLKRNKAYSAGDIAYSHNLPSWAYLECTTAGTTGATEPDFSTGFTEKTVIILSKFTVLDGTCTWRLRDTRCKYEVGDIIPKVGSPKAYEYLILADGSAFDTTAYTELAKVFTNGKVPNLTDGRFLEGGVTAGIVKGAGLPNITGVFGNIYTYNDQISTKGALKVDAVDLRNPHTPYPSADKGAKLSYKFDASYSNNIYGSSDTVQPKSYTVKYYICYGG